MNINLNPHRIRIRASSSESLTCAPECAIDGIAESRWSSTWSEPHWLELDLGSTVAITSIGILWETSRAKEYTIAHSINAQTWSTCIRTINQRKDELSDSHIFDDPISARYLRIDCLNRVRPDYGFSIFQIFINHIPLIADMDPEDLPFPDAPFRNCRLSAEDRTDDLAHRLTFDELVYLTGGFSFFYIAPLRRFALPAIRFADASMGVRFVNPDDPRKSTSFPASIALAATWDPHLAYEYARALGEECRAYGISVLLGPGVNIYRTSMCGRNFEYMGEDPYLTSRVAVAYVKGMQSTGTMSCIKHFACNNHEWLRHNTNSVVDERTFNEIYLPAFKAAIQEADLMAVMTSYNYYNGEKASQSRELIDGILRKQLAFTNLIMSDWSAVQDGDKVLGSGQDLVMPDNSMVNRFIADHPEKRDTIAEHLQRMAKSILHANFKMGFYDRPPADPSLLDRLPLHEQTALKTARAAITLLKNNGILPLAAKPSTTILVTGPGANGSASSGLGSGYVKGFNQITYLDGLRNKFGDAIHYIADPTDDQLAAADAVIVFPHIVEEEGNDRWFELPTAQEALLCRCVARNNHTAVVISQGGGIRMSAWIEKANAVIFAYYLGQSHGTALAEVISGAVNPGGKLPFSIEKEFADSPAAGYLPTQVMTERHKERLNDHFTNLEAFIKEGFSEPIDVPYTEGIFVGYRWYERKNKAPLFPFGHGLSYTTFSYDDLQVRIEKIWDELIVHVGFAITNTGSREGSEVAQVYVGDPQARLERPVKELKGFLRVNLAAGEQKQVELSLDKTAFAYYDPSIHDWVVEPGLFEILVGSSSQNILLKATMHL